MAELASYERAQLRAIERWKAEPPGIIAQAAGVALAPVAWVARRIVPAAAIETALAAGHAIARDTAGARDILERARAASVAELRARPLDVCDSLADAMHSRAVGAATVEGAASGVMGLAAAPIDVPAMIVLALRTVHRIGMCYGFEGAAEGGERFALAVLSAACANSMAEKKQALGMLAATLEWSSAAEMAAGRQLGREATIVAIRTLARQLSANTAKRRALSAVPVLGAATGAAVNGGFINDVAWAARRAFQERWFAARAVSERV